MESGNHRWLGARPRVCNQFPRYIFAGRAEGSERLEAMVRVDEAAGINSDPLPYWENKGIGKHEG